MADSRNRMINLRIKSASHKFAEDMELVLQMSSTVKQVKELIRTNSPFHPEIREQRLIYSGHLLEDGQVLADFLIPNTDGGEESYVIHLSCTVTRRDQDLQQQVPMAPGPMINNTWLPTNQTEATISQEMAALHALYLQQMLCFMTQWNGGGGGPAVPINGFQPPMQNMQHPEPQQQQPPPRVVNANRDRGEDEEGQADVLDWIYTLSRVALIFSVVYFYSNLTRLVLVVVCTSLVFILQRRHARRQEAQNVAAAARPPAPNLPPPVVNPNPEVPVPAAAAAPNDPTTAPNEQVEPEPADPAAVPIPTSLPEAPPVQVNRASVWTFVTAFVTSLIPDMAQH